MFRKNTSSVDFDTNEPKWGMKKFRSNSENTPKMRTVLKIETNPDLRFKDTF